MKQKTCVLCKVEKHVKHFAKRNDSIDGYRKQCKSCRKKARAERMQNVEYYLRHRANSLNDPNGRRTGKAGKVIKNSEPICYKKIIKLYIDKPFCTFCKINLQPKEIVFDHDIPLSRGGEHTISNINLVCIDCNSLKTQKTGFEFNLFLRDYLRRFKTSF